MIMVQELPDNGLRTGGRAEIGADLMRKMTTNCNIKLRNPRATGSFCKDENRMIIYGDIEMQGTSELPRRYVREIEAEDHARTDA